MAVTKWKPSQFIWGHLSYSEKTLKVSEEYLIRDWNIAMVDTMNIVIL